MTTVAIDFGTSNTVVAYLDPVTQAPITLRFNQISRPFETAVEQLYVIPSLVFVAQENSLLFGEQVRSQRLGMTQPKRFFQGFKRLLVADYQPPPRYIDGQSYTPEYISELFLQKIWQQLAKERVQPNHLIFTAPVGAFERYLNWFQDFADTLNVSTVQIVDESTAAALCYAVQKPGTLVLVVDFGGGTLDLSLVRTVSASSNQQFLQAEVLAKVDAHVGGIDIDAWIAENYLAQIGCERSEIGEIGWQNLLEVAERLKIQLSKDVEAKERWLDDENFKCYELQLSQDELEEILESRQLLEQLRQALDEVLEVAKAKGISKTDIEQVLLVGGSCQITAVQQLLISYFGRRRVRLDKPFEAVAHGALKLVQLQGIKDYLRHSYAIRTWNHDIEDYVYTSLFEQGTQYPCQSQEPLILQVATDGQDEIELDIGELAESTQFEVIYDNQGRMTTGALHKEVKFHHLGSRNEEVSIARLYPPGDIGVNRIKVLFEVNEQRVLLATVKDLLTEEVLSYREVVAKLT